MADSELGAQADDQLSPQETRDAVAVLQTVLEKVGTGGSVSYHCTEFDRLGDTVGFAYRNRSLMIEYQTSANAAGDRPSPDATTGTLVELEDHAPLSDASTRYAGVESDLLDLVADTVPAVAARMALGPVTIWPVQDAPGLYRVGYDIGTEQFLYSVAFRLPPDTLQQH